MATNLTTLNKTKLIHHRNKSILTEMTKKKLREEEERLWILGRERKNVSHYERLDELFI